MKETRGGGSASTTTTTTFYPSLDGPVSTSSTTASASQPPKSSGGTPAKILYDFEASESNELSLHAGETVHVLDDSDSNWWKGRNHLGRQGFFPASFASYDLRSQLPAPVVETSPTPLPEPASDDGPTSPAEEEEAVSGGDNVADGDKFDRLQELLEAELEGDDSRLAEREALERECEAMLPALQTRVEDIDARLGRVTKVMDKYSLLMTLCNRLMTEPPARRVHAQVPPPPQQQQAYTPPYGAGMPPGAAPGYGAPPPGAGMSYGPPGGYPMAVHPVSAAAGPPGAGMHLPPPAAAYAASHQAPSYPPPHGHPQPYGQPGYPQPGGGGMGAPGYGVPPAQGHPSPHPQQPHASQGQQGQPQQPGQQQQQGQPQQPQGHYLPPGQQPPPGAYVSGVW
jgi:hypothetical protein